MPRILVLANFVFKSPHFRCHGNKGRSGVNFDDTVKMCKLDNPVWCNIRGSISYITRVIANFVLIFPHCCYHGNMGRFDVSFNVAIKFPGLENAVW